MEEAPRIPKFITIVAALLIRNLFRIMKIMFRFQSLEPGGDIGFPSFIYRLDATCFIMNWVCDRVIGKKKKNKAIPFYSLSKLRLFASQLLHLRSHVTIDCVYTVN